MSNSDNVSNGVWEKQPSVCWGFLRLGANEENKEGSLHFFSKKNCLPIDCVKAENAT